VSSSVANITALPPNPVVILLDPLLDLPGAPRPHPDTPAPVRFLPAFDNAILGYHDRSRVSVAGLRAVLVDGRAAATWTVRGDGLDVTPLRPLSAAERDAVHDEARALGAFLDQGIGRVRFTAKD
jgi:hypothetical protein